MAVLPSIQAANDVFTATKASLSGKTITNFRIEPGYGFYWTQDGENRSARVSWVEKNDAQFIQEFSNLMGLSTTSSGKGLTSAAAGGMLTNLWSNPVIKYGLIALGAWFVYKKFIKKRRR